MSKGKRNRQSRAIEANRFKMTPPMEKAMQGEIRRQIRLADEKYNRGFCAMVLWACHEVFGVGPIRLKRLFDQYNLLHEELMRRYELGTEDQPWLAENQLREIGVDLDEWYKG